MRIGDIRYWLLFQIPTPLCLHALGTLGGAGDDEGAAAHAVIQRIPVSDTFTSLFSEPFAMLQC